jgi:hypothetical protein
LDEIDYKWIIAIQLDEIQIDGWVSKKKMG